MTLLEIIQEAGIVGAGGAGFPTHIKYAVETEYFILNAAECEPLIHSDKYLIRTRAIDIISTMELVAKHIKASKLIIAIKKTYTDEIQALHEAIGNKNITLCLMNSYYPAGDEHVIIFEATGKQVPIGKLPKDVGVTVSNISTICDIADACKNEAKTTKVLSVVGNVKIPSIFTVPIGMKITECLDASVLLDKHYTLIIGGPMMGRILKSDEIEDEVITKTVNSLIVLEKNHYLLKRQNTPMQHMKNQALSACIQCRQCTDLCPRYLIGHPLYPHKIMRSISMENIQTNSVFESALLCCGCGLCSFVCPMGLSPRSINQMIKGELTGKKQANGDLEHPIVFRDYRKTPTGRLLHMLDIQKYKSQIPEHIQELSTLQVRILLKQHIGKVSTPLVTIGSSVKKGDCIASIAENSLGANMHASIAGKVTDITNDYIEITT